MKNLIIISVFSLLLINVSAQDFRKAKWGDNISTVKASEPDAAWSQQTTGIYEILSFPSTISGIDASVVYLFVDNKLVRTDYMFRAEHTNKNDYISDFNKIFENLKTKYGETKVEKNWSNDLYKDDYSDWGFAVSLGHYSLWGQWDLENTVITAVLNGENYDINHQVEYSSKVYQSLVDQKEKAADSEAF